MVTEDGLMLFITRLELKAIQASENRALYQSEKRRRDIAERDLSVARRNRDQLDEDLKATVAKLGEWEQYGERLRAMLEARRVRKLPAAPEPLETDIPF